jgi:hypothetical protein
LPTCIEVLDVLAIIRSYIVIQRFVHVEITVGSTNIVINKAKIPEREVMRFFSVIRKFFREILYCYT